MAIMLTLGAMTIMYAQFTRSVQQIPVGNSDSQGYARMDCMFYKMSLGDGETADLFFKFSSNPNISPNYLGLYWSIPFFDTHIVKTSKNRYLWKSPNHGTYTFEKLRKTTRGNKETYVLNTTGLWKLNILKDHVYIYHVSDIKKYFKFKNDKLIEFCNGFEADVFRIYYQNKMPILIYNITKREEEMSFVYNTEKLLTDIQIKNSKKISISYVPCNTFNSKGENLKNKYKTISLIKYTDGSVEKYTYHSEANCSRVCLFANQQECEIKNIPSNILEKIKNNRDSGCLRWDAITGMIISDSGGQYSIYNPFVDKLNPDFDNAIRLPNNDILRQVSCISYKRPNCKYAEIWEYDSSNAVKFTQNPNTGEGTRVSYIASKGNSSMKIRKIEQKAANHKLWHIKLLRMYNEDGNIIREIDNNNNISEWKYLDTYGSYVKFKNTIMVEKVVYNSERRMSIFEDFIANTRSHYVYHNIGYDVYKYREHNLIDYWKYNKNGNIIDSFQKKLELLQQLYKQK